MLCAVYKVERSEEFQSEKSYIFRHFGQCSIPNVAVSLYSGLKIRKFKWALATKDSIKCVRLWKLHRDEGQPVLRRRSKLKSVFKTASDYYFFILSKCFAFSMFQVTQNEFTNLWRIQFQNCLQNVISDSNSQLSDYQEL